MVRYLILPILITLSGCASQTVKDFTPFTVEIKNDQVYQNDLSLCRSYAKAYLDGRAGLDASQIAREGATAGLSNLGYSVLSPAAPALSALGGASGEAVSELGLSSVEAKRIIVNCLYAKGTDSKAYLVLDPHL